MSWSMSPNVYLQVHLEACLNILALSSLKGLAFESQPGIKIAALEEPSESL